MYTKFIVEYSIYLAQVYSHKYTNSNLHTHKFKIKNNNAINLYIFFKYYMQLSAFFCLCFYFLVVTALSNVCNFIQKTCTITAKAITSLTLLPPSKNHALVT